MKTTPSQKIMVGLSLLALASVSVFASDPTPVSASQETLLKSFPYKTTSSELATSAPVVETPVVALGDDAEVAKTAPVQMKTVQVKDSAERQYRAFAEAMAFSDPTAARALYTKDLGHNVQFEALGGPIFPTLGENAIHGEQPRFPVVGLNW